MISPAAPSARTLATAGVVLAVQLLVSLVLVATAAAGIGLLSVGVVFDPPVTSDGAFGLMFGARVAFSPEVAMLSVLAVAGVVVAVAAFRAWRGTLTAQVASTLHWVAVSQSLGITIVIVALLNGVDEAATIVALYALAAGSATLGWLSDRAERADTGRAHLWPYAFLTALAIVPWGVVALVQVTGLVVGAPASAGVRVVTLVILAATAAWAAAEWAVARPAGRAAQTPEAAARLRVVAATALAGIPAAAVLVLGLIGG